MKLRSLVFCFSLFFITPSFTQSYVYEFINATLDTEKSPSYVGLYSNFKALEERVYPLDEAEGSEGYRVEAHLPFRFAIRQKRRIGNARADQEMIPFLTDSRIFIDYGFHTRVPKKIESGPIFPPTNRWGIQFEKIAAIWKHGRMLRNSWSFNRQKTDKFFKESHYSYLAASAYLHHYSNGQGAGVFKRDTISGQLLNRNDYLDGDFSTNFARFSLSYHLYKADKYHLGLIAGYQHDFGQDDWQWSYRAEQEDRYGRHRLMFTGVLNVKCFVSFYSKKKRRRIGIIEQFNMRADISYIMDHESLTAYPYEDKYPLGAHFYFEIPVAPVPALGIMFHWYRGRDYLNIRYDDPVQMFQIGLGIEINRFTIRAGDEE